MALLAGCMAGASSVHELESMLAEVGFTEISIKPEDESREFMREWTPGQDRGICGLRDLCCEPEHRQTLATSPDHFQSGKP